MPETSPHASPGPNPQHLREQRLHDVREGMLARHSLKQIYRDISTKWAVSETTVKNDLAHVRKEWERESALYIRHRRELVIRRLERLSALAADAENYNLAVGCEIAIGRFLGLGGESFGRVEWLGDHRTVEGAVSDPHYKVLVSTLRRMAPNFRRALLLRAAPNGEEPPKIIEQAPPTDGGNGAGT